MYSFMASAKFGEAMGKTDSSSIFYGAIAAVKSENYDYALTEFTKTVDLGYQVSTSATYLGDAYVKLERADEGEEKLSEILKSNPGNKDVMISLINMYLTSGKKDKAEKVLSDAIALDP